MSDSAALVTYEKWGAHRKIAPSALDDAPFIEAFCRHEMERVVGDRGEVLEVEWHKAGEELGWALVVISARVMVPV